MGTQRFTATKGDKSGFVHKRVCGDCILGCSWTNILISHGVIFSLTWKNRTNKWRVLCELAPTIKWQNQREIASFEQEVSDFPSG